jgi:hypothetical protein
LDAADIPRNAICNRYQGLCPEKESDIVSPYKLHFFNSESELAYVVESTYDGGTLIAKIPNVLVMQPFEIIGYVYDENASGGGQSLVRFSMDTCGLIRLAQVLHLPTGEL